MFAFKDNYYLYIENTQILNLSLFKNKKKFIIIYRNVGKKENVHELIKFRLRCKQKNIKFFIANDIKHTYTALLPDYFRKLLKTKRLRFLDSK